MVRKRIAATREELFDAWTDPESMRAWMCPGNVVSAEVELEPRVGGALWIVMRASTSETFEHKGEFQVVARPSKLVFTWMAKAMDWRPTLVTVEFLEIAARETELVLTHEEFPEPEVRERYQSGWERIVHLLETFLERK